MLNDLIIYYLFLGGAGSGATLILAIAGLFVPKDMIVAKRANGLEAPGSIYPSIIAPPVYKNFFLPTYLTAIVVIALGIVFLLIDIGRFDRLIYLITSPSLSLITIGAYALVITVALALLVLATWGGVFKQVSYDLFLILHIFLIISSIVVMLYTGVLLYSFKAVPFWGTFMIVILFMFSAISCGIALVLGITNLTNNFRYFKSALKYAIRSDIVIIILEFNAVLFYVYKISTVQSTLLTVPDSFTISTQALLFETYAKWFWGGFVFIGLIVPFLLQSYVLFSRNHSQKLELIASTCVLVGGFIMRMSIVYAGLYSVNLY